CVCPHPTINASEIPQVSSLDNLVMDLRKYQNRPQVDTINWPAILPPLLRVSEQHQRCKVGLRRSMKRILTFLVLGALLCVIACSTGWAQGATAQISGTVKDQSGAVLPGAEI